MSQVASQSRSQPEQGAKPSAILRAQGVQKAYRMGDETVTILRHIDLTLREGEFVAPSRHLPLGDAGRFETVS